MLTLSHLHQSRIQNTTRLMAARTQNETLEGPSDRIGQPGERRVQQVKGQRIQMKIQLYQT